MNILYYTNVNSSLPLELGVFKKVIAQCNVLKMKGHKVILGCTDGLASYSFQEIGGIKIETIDLASVSKFSKHNTIHKYTIDFVKRHDINFLYSRYGDLSLAAFRFYKQLKSNKIGTVIEIPTYPLNQRWNPVKQCFSNKDYVSAIKQVYLNTIGSLGIPLFRFSVDRIVNNNGFKKIWGINVLPITNGIDVSSIKGRAHFYKAGSDINIVSVANVAHWHGFDRLLCGLYEYYQKKPTRKVTFELVGPGMEVELLKRQAKELGLTEYITFLGPIWGENLDSFYERADIGVGVLGVHRNNMKVYDCLKSREFCARKLPFVTEPAEYSFKDRPFVKYVPEDESAINITEIVKLFDETAGDSSLLDQMYLFAKEKCDWSYAFKNVVDYINTIENEKQ